MSICINDIIDNDILYYILDRVFTIKEWYNINFVCRRWGVVCNALRDKKAKQYSKYNVSTRTLPVFHRINELDVIWCDRVIKTSFYYLPNERLHGEYTKIVRIFETNSQELVEEERIVKRFKFGTFVDETCTKYINEFYQE